MLASPDPAGREASVADLYIELRLQVDGVRLEPSDVAAAICGHPLEDRFVWELVPQTPASVLATAPPGLDPGDPDQPAATHRSAPIAALLRPLPQPPATGLTTNGPT